MDYNMTYNTNYHTNYNTNASHTNYMERAEANRSRRQAREAAVLKQKRRLLIILFLLVLILGLFSMKAFVLAGEKNERTTIKTYQSVLIYRGDTLTSIAEAHRDSHYPDPDSYIREIAFMNHIDTDAILIPGNHLIVPLIIEEAAE